MNRFSYSEVRKIKEMVFCNIYISLANLLKYIQHIALLVASIFLIVYTQWVPDMQEASRPSDMRI